MAIRRISTIDEKAEFVRKLKVAFQDDGVKYDQFHKLWRDLKFKRIRMRIFIAKMNSLFKDHKYLFWAFIKFLPEKCIPPEVLEFSKAAEVLKFFKAVKVALKDDYHDFSKVVEDYRKREMDERGLLARVEVLLRGHAYLLTEMKTLLPTLQTLFHVAPPLRVQLTFPPRWDRLAFPRWDQLPFNVLDVISRKLDFDDLFQFSRVCTNWRVFHKSIEKSRLLTSQEPLHLEFLYSPVKVQCSFTSLPNQKVYPLKNIMMNMLSYSDDTFPIYVTYSSGYFVIIADNSSFLLIDPFTQIKKKVICPSTFEFSLTYQHLYNALLAFDKCSEEFVLLFLNKETDCLHVYQSRNNVWVTYSTVDDDDIVIDFVALNNIIYVVTVEARIGVLHLNSANIEYLRMVNPPDLNLPFFNLVTCDGELLLVQNVYTTTVHGPFPPMDKKVYKIDFSTMTYVELKTLGGIALFYVFIKSCKALSNPNKWGYEGNFVYELGHNRRDCMVYNWDKKSTKYIVPPNPISKYRKVKVDWCFRHLKYEVDYSIYSSS